MERITVIILNFNGVEDTIECIRSLTKVTLDNFKLSIIIVDNGSSEKNKNKLNHEVSKTRKQGINIELIENEKNLGFAEGNNIGIKTALQKKADYVLILNNDVVVDNNSIKELFKIAKSNKEVGIVVPKIYFAKGFEFHKNRYKEEELGRVIWYAGGKIDWKNVLCFHKGVDEVDHGQFDKIEKTDFATGCCMLVKKEVFEKIGMFNRDYYLYYEDGDFSKRAQEAGFKILYCPTSFIWHKNAGSAGGSGSILQTYYITRNRLLFGMKYAPLRTRLALIKESMRLLLIGEYWQKLGVLDFYLRRFNKGSYN